MSMLTNWAVAVRPTASQTTSPDVIAALDHDLAEMTPASLFRAASRVDAARAALDLPTIIRMTRALTIVNLMAESDRFGLADPLRARGLALIAMARAIDPTALAEEQAVVARLMRYDKEASEAAVTLPTDSFARVWVSGAGSPAPQNVLSDYVIAAVILRTSRSPLTAEAFATWRVRLGDR